MGKLVDQNRRVAERKVVTVPIEFVMEGDLIHATSVDISETGIRIDMNEPLSLHIRFEHEGEDVNYTARFVWARKTGDGGMTYGLEFIGEPDIWDDEI